MARYEEYEIETDLVPSPVKYTVMIPNSYDDSHEKYPMMLILHGGGGDNSFLKNQIGPIVDVLWDNGDTIEMIIATPDCDRSLYLDYRDGAQKWESFIIKEFLPHLETKYRVETDTSKHFIGGISMGGMGSLRIAFKYPNKFGVVMSFEPGIEPALEWKDVKVEDKFYRAQEFLEERFGSPIDENYWKVNNPASILSNNPEKIRESDLKIYLEVGTEDMFYLFHGTEFLHRILYDNNIKHEFRYVYGADHVGSSFRERLINGFSFLKRVLDLPDPNLDPQITAARKVIDVIKKKAGLNK